MIFMGMNYSYSLHRNDESGIKKICMNGNKVLITLENTNTSQNFT